MKTSKSFRLDTEDMRKVYAFETVLKKLTEKLDHIRYHCGDLSINEIISKVAELDLDEIEIYDLQLLSHLKRVIETESDNEVFSFLVDNSV